MFTTRRLKRQKHDFHDTINILTTNMIRKWMRMFETTSIDFTAVWANSVAGAYFFEDKRWRALTVRHANYYNMILKNLVEAEISDKEPEE